MKPKGIQAAKSEKHNLRDAFTRPAQKWLRRHPVIALLLAALSFLFIFLPPYASDVWALTSDRPLFTVLREQLSGLQSSQFSVAWVTTPIGFIGLFTILYLLVAGRREIQPPADSQLLNDRIAELEREKTALEKARQNASDLYEKARRENDGLQMALTGKINDLESNKWLHELAARDKNNVSRYVYIIFDRIDYEGLAELSPYIEIIFYIINASVYIINIDKNIEDGAVYLNGVELNPKQAKIDGSLKYISRDDRGEKKLLVIKQWLTPTEVARIRNPLPDDKLYFSRLKLIVNGAYDTEGVLPQRLSLPSSVPVAVKTTAELTADYTARLDELSTTWHERAGKIEELTRMLGMFYLAYNQLEQRESVSKETANNLKGRYANALQRCFNDNKIVDEYLDNVPPFPDSINEQKEWVDWHCFKLRSLIDEQRQ